MKALTTEQHTESLDTQPKVIFHHENRRKQSELRPATIGVPLRDGCRTGISAVGSQVPRRHEHFAYPAGAISGQNGGIGWSGPWAGTGNAVSRDLRSFAMVNCLRGMLWGNRWWLLPEHSIRR